MTAVSGGWVQGRPRLKVACGAKVAFGNEGITLEAAQRYERVKSPGAYVYD